MWSPHTAQIYTENNNTISQQITDERRNKGIGLNNKVRLTDLRVCSVLVPVCCTDSPFQRFIS